ncbi:MAG: flagellar brake protein [Lachnospiraceae bacterium]|nr:flagellar brake protein [Lachnospiraceae bacterium]
MIEQEFLLSKFISPGARIELVAIERVLHDDGAEKKVYESKVVDVIGEDRLEIFMPIEQTKLVLLPVNGEYHIHFITNKGLFQCDAKVANRYKNGALYLLEMKLISPLQKYQRREYYRFPCMIDMEVRELTADEKRGIEQEGQFFAEDDLSGDKAVILDLSGGGLRFTSETPFEPKSIVVCNYVLRRESGNRRMCIAGELLSCKRLENNPGQYEQRVRFMYISPREREDNIRFIFEEERKRRQRES